MLLSDSTSLLLQLVQMPHYGCPDTNSSGALLVGIVDSQTPRFFGSPAASKKLSVQPFSTPAQSADSRAIVQLDDRAVEQARRPGLAQSVAAAASQDLACSERGASASGTLEWHSCEIALSPSRPKSCPCAEADEHRMHGVLNRSHSAATPRSCARCMGSRASHSAPFASLAPGSLVADRGASSGSICSESCKW
jgi:hypothetical protein